MKYEAVFGNQELFDGAGTFTGLDVVVHSIASGIKSYARLSDLTPESLRNHPVCAMRRIIKEPKRWTAEDQKAGRLPDVGCLVVSKTGKVSEVATIKNGYFVLFECGKSNGPLTMHGDLLMKQFKPIESPEEKAKRLRSEWISKAYVDFHRLGCELEVLQKEQVKVIYDALLSGELTMPSKDGE